MRPYHLHHWRSEPYLIAWCEWRNAFRDFFLGRIREWTLLPPCDEFARQAAFDAEAYLQPGFALRHGEALVTGRDAPPASNRTRLELKQAETVRMLQIMEQYAGRPMALADALLAGGTVLEVVPGPVSRRQ